MNAKLKCFLPAVLLLVAGLTSARANPAMIVQVIQTEDVESYVTLLAQANAAIKASTGIEKLRHAWVGDYAGENSHGLFVVSQFESAAAAYTVTDKLNSDPEMTAILAKFKAIRKLGPSMMYKAVRNDGFYDGGAVFNTSISCSDEPAYVKAIGELKALFDANGFKDAKLNLWRVVAGRSDSTHLVVIALPSQKRVGELLDAIADVGFMKDWNLAAAKIRTTVRNGSYHEITK